MERAARKGPALSTLCKAGILALDPRRRVRPFHWAPAYDPARAQGLAVRRLVSKTLARGLKRAQGRFNLAQIQVPRD